MGFVHSIAEPSCTCLGSDAVEYFVNRLGVGPARSELSISSTRFGEPRSIYFIALSRIETEHELFCQLLTPKRIQFERRSLNLFFGKWHTHSSFSIELARLRTALSASSNASSCFIEPRSIWFQMFMTS
jgi:hypothetical protein